MNNILKFMLIASLIIGCSVADPFEWKDDYDISLMSFNLRYDTEEDEEDQWNNRKEACIKMLKKTKPSIFGIQEGLRNQVNYLEDNLPEYKYVGVGNIDGHSSGEYKAIFYLTKQFELIESNTFWLSETPDYPSRGWDANNIRIVTWAKFKDTIHNKTVFVFNTHFDHIGETSQIESGKLLMKNLKTLTANDANAYTFITGDFNVLIRDPALEPILKRLYSARRFADYTDNIKSFNFFGRWYLSRNIDFIFYDKAKALSFRTVAEDFGVPYISDHYPIITHFNYSK